MLLSCCHELENTLFLRISKGNCEFQVETGPKKTGKDKKLTINKKSTIHGLVILTKFHDDS